MRLGVLGPLLVTVDGELVEIGGVRLRALLIRLALDAGRTVTTASLTSALWPDDGPADAANALQTLVSRLRRALPRGDVVRSAPGGYCLEVPPEAVDALRFERLAREGRRALGRGEPAMAARRLRESLGLWRGDALADVAEAPFAAPAVVRLDELRLAATEDRLEAELRVSPEGSYLVAELEELTAAHPLRERLRHLLIKALHGEGRQAEALAAYEDFGLMLLSGMGHLAAARDDLAAAHEHLGKALAMAAEAPDMPLMAIVAVGVARLTLQHGAARSAAQVLGAAHTLRGAPDAFNPDVVRLVEDLRGEMGERDYEAAYAAGRGLARADALALIDAQMRC